MSDETKNQGTDNTDSSGAVPSVAGWDTVTRRGLLKALVSIPFFGAFFLAFFKKKAVADMRKQAVLEELGVTESGPAVIPDMISSPPGERIRVGIIGMGGEGEALVRFAGFAHPDWVENSRQDSPGRLETYLAQQDLNIAITAACDMFDVRAERALAASSTDTRPGGASANPPARRFRSYTDMLESGEVDAVIIATPDHWHSQIAIDAASAGIHVYCEKCMTQTEEQTHAMYDAVKASDIVFQLGHQNRQSEAHNKAREIIAADILHWSRAPRIGTIRGVPGCGIFTRRVILRP
jgi:hypothetical protein